ncbi:MAG: histidine kinase [Bacteroidota bacterium]
MPNRYRILFLIILFPFFCLGQLSISLKEEHFDLKNGLPGIEILSIAQDSMGYLWIGTSNGIARFDGYAFESFSYQEGQENIIPGNIIEEIYVDSKGMVWIGTLGNGIACYNPYTHKSAFFQKNLNSSISLPSNYVSAFLEDIKGDIWIGSSRGGISRLREQQIQSWAPSNFLSKEKPSLIDCIFDIQQSPIDSNILWISTRNGLISFDKLKANQNESNPFELHKHPSQEKGNWVTTHKIIFDQDSSLWIGSWEGRLGLLHYFPEKKKWESFTYNDSSVWNGVSNVIFDLEWKNKNEIWIGTHDNGIGSFSKSDHQFKFLSPELENPAFSSDRTVREVLIDRNNIIWGASQNGLKKFDPNRKTIEKKLFGQEFGPIIIFEDMVKIPQSQNVLVAVNNNSFLLDINLKSKDYTWIKIDSINIKSIAPISKDQFLITGYSRKKGTLSGLHLYNNESKEMAPVDQVWGDWLNPIKGKPGYLVKKGPLGIYWMLSHRNRLWRIDLQNKHLSEFTFEQIIGREETEYDIIQDFIFDSSGKIWFAVHQGISCYDPLAREGKFISLLSKDIQRAFVTIVSDQNGSIWAGSLDGGIFKVQPHSPYHYEQFTSKNGLNSERIWKITKGPGDEIWLATTGGLYKLDPKNNQFQNYSTLFGKTFTHLTVDPTGLILLGSNDGLRWFYPDKLPINIYSPVPLITSFKVLNEPFPLDSSIQTKKSISLNYDQNFFSFEFSSVNFTTPEDQNYLYRLEGLDPKWINSNGRRYASYSNVAPGKYSFQVKAFNNDGIESEYPAEISIQRLPAYWETKLFKAFFIFSIITIVFALYNFRVQQIRKEENLKNSFDQQLIEVKEMALRSQMNPHFIFNCLNSIDNLLIKNNRVAAMDYLTKFAHLIRIILNHARKDYVSLEKELKAWYLYVEIEQLRFKQDFDFRCSIAEDLTLSETILPPNIVQPYIENAILHGLLKKNGTKKLRLDILKKERKLHIVISDNGIGREEAASYRVDQGINRESLGTKITKDRLALVSKKMGDDAEVDIKDLYQKDGRPAGTQVTLSIPEITT